MKCYIDYLDCKDNFREARKDFKDYETALKWLISDFDKFSTDMINYY